MRIVFNLESRTTIQQLKPFLNIQLLLAFFYLVENLSKQLFLLLLFSMSLQLYLARLLLLMNSNIHCSCQVISSLLFPSLYIFWKEATFQNLSILCYLLFLTFYLTLIFSVLLNLLTYPFISISSHRISSRLICERGH